MELATFGAVVTFSLAFERELGGLYRQIQGSAPAEFKPELERLAKACARRGGLLERVRRENVTEMILEPIAGFESEDYALPSAPGADSQAIARWMAEAQRIAVSFYGAGAQNLSIPEVQRIFQRLAKEHVERR